jgi:hypothetical protein
MMMLTVCAMPPRFRMDQGRHESSIWFSALAGSGYGACGLIHRSKQLKLLDRFVAPANKKAAL